MITSLPCVSVGFSRTWHSVRWRGRSSVPLWRPRRCHLLRPPSGRSSSFCGGRLRLFSGKADEMQNTEQFPGCVNNFRLHFSYTLTICNEIFHYVAPQYLRARVFEFECSSSMTAWRWTWRPRIPSRAWSRTQMCRGLYHSQTEEQVINPWSAFQLFKASCHFRTNQDCVTLKCILRFNAARSFLTNNNMP